MMEATAAFTSLVGTEVQIKTPRKVTRRGGTRDEALRSIPGDGTSAADPLASPSLDVATATTTSCDSRSVDDQHDPHRPVSPANPAEMLFLSSELTQKREQISATALAQQMHDLHRPFVSLSLSSRSHSGTGSIAWRSAAPSSRGGASFVTAPENHESVFAAALPSRDHDEAIDIDSPLRKAFTSSSPSDAAVSPSHSASSSSAAAVNHQRVRRQLGWSPSMDSIDDDDDFPQNSNDTVNIYNSDDVNPYHNHHLNETTEPIPAANSIDTDDSLYESKRAGPFGADIFATAVHIGPDFHHSPSNKSVNSDDFHEASESPEDDMADSRERPTEESTSEITVVHVDAAEKVYVTAKQVWGWGKDQWFASPFLGLAETIASQLVDRVAHTSLPALDQNVITPQLFRFDDYVLNPVVSKVLHTLRTAWGKSEEIVSPVVSTVLSPLAFLMPPANRDRGDATEESYDAAGSSSTMMMGSKMDRSAANEPPEVSTTSAATAH